MNHENQLKLQSYLDGELSERESQEVANWLAQDEGAIALLRELRQTRKALAGFEETIRLPESREFYWSKIERQIQAQEATASRPVEPQRLLARFRRLVVPLTGLALVATATLVATRGFRPHAAAVETSLADSGAMIYHDYSAGATFVWLSYPADNEIAEDDDLDTLD